MNNDLISRSALKEAVDDYAEKRQDTLLWQSDIEDLIDNAPTVELSIGRMVNGVIIPIKIPHGEWTVKSSGTTNYFVCNTCGSAGDIQDKYCRECGLKMKSSNNNEER